MCKVDTKQINKLYSNTMYRSYFFGLVGFVAGVKLCDAIFYDQRKHDIQIEEMED
jgi:hypothetical protein